MKKEGPWDLDEAGLSQRERSIALYAERDPLTFATSTAVQIAHQTSTSEAMVARTAQKLGYAGTKQMKQACASVVGQAQSMDAAFTSLLAALPSEQDGGGAYGTAKAVLSSSAEILLTLSDALNRPEFSQVLSAISIAKRNVVYGLGTAFHIAEYLSLCLERIGKETLLSTGSGHTIADSVIRLRQDDVVIVFSPRIIPQDIVNFVIEAAARTKQVILMSEIPAPEEIQGDVLQLTLPATSRVPASESICALALADVIVAELAREQPQRALEVRTQVQRLRDRLSP